MSELQHYYDNFRAGSFQRTDRTQCGCRGTGYALSEVDTWHKCPIHYTPGQRHPEDDHDECVTLTVDVLDARTIEAMAAVTPAVINNDEIPF